MKKPTKSIITSSLLAVAFGALSVGTTFALFTSQSQTEIDVGAGIVNVESGASLVRYRSTVEGGEGVDLTNLSEYTNPLIGNHFGLEGTVVTIDKMVPGDSLTVKLSALNKSNVKTKTRLVVTHATVGTKTDLYPALDLDFSVASEAGPAGLFRWQTNDPVAEDKMATGVKLYDDLSVTITFVDHDNGQILFGSQNQDNQYQDAACSIAFTIEAVQGNAATSPIDEINAYLVAEKIVEGQNKTMYDAVQDMKEIGFNNLSVLTYNNVKYVFDLDNDQFVAENTVTANHHRYFKVCSAMSDAGNFSIYAANDFTVTGGAVALSGVGFDCGDNAGIATVNYSDSGASRRVILRTQCNTLTVNAATDHIDRYGYAAYVDLQEVSNNTYVEHGTVGLVNLVKGRIVAENTASISGIYIANFSGENTIIALKDGADLPKLYRNEVELEANQIVVVAQLQILKDDLVAETNNIDYIKLTGGDNEVTAYISTTNSTEAEDQATAQIETSTETLEESNSVEAIKELTKCSHPNMVYIDNEDGATHTSYCDICGYSHVELHNYMNDCEECTKCHYHGNCVTLNNVEYTVVTDAFAAFNASTVNSEHVLRFGPGIYNLPVNTMLIEERKADGLKDRGLVIQGTMNNQEYQTIIKPDYSNTTIQQIQNCMALFSVSGLSSSTYDHGYARFINLSFDLTENMMLHPNAVANSTRINAVHALSGGSGAEDPLFPEASSGGYHRYAHDITIDNCHFEGPGGKYANAFGAHANSSPKNITISNCTGTKLNCWANAYGTGYNIENCVANNFLIVGNFQSNGGDAVVANIKNVSGTYFAQLNNLGTEEKTGGTEDGCIRSKGGKFYIEDCNLQTFKAKNNSAGIIYVVDGTSEFYVKNCAFNKVNGTYDIYVKTENNFLYLNGASEGTQLSTGGRNF